MSFKKLNKAELVAAVDAFALDVEVLEPEVIRDALEDSGVTAEMFVEMFPDTASKFKTKKAKADNPKNVVVDEPRKFVASSDYLVKMVRKNPYFEVASKERPGFVFKFTKDHPYNLMGPEDAEHVLSGEEGFRIATPKELQDFYEK